MTESLSSIPEGLQYIAGEELRRRRSVEANAMSVFDGWSYEEIATPTVDYYSLFERAMGPFEAHHAFRFIDTDGRLLALRPDVTSGIARAAATLFVNRPRPLRFCYAAPAFRLTHRSHAVWRRESIQIGCELIGKNTLAADMEVLAIACEILNRLGLNGKYVITLNDVEIFNGIAENLGFDSGARDQLRLLMDGRNQADLESFLTPHVPAHERHAFSKLIRLSGKQETFEAARRVITNSRSQLALDRLESLWRLVDDLSLSDRFEIDFGDVSRIDYYTGLTFKIYIEGGGARVGSGGRYDNLTANFGKAEPAVGFVLDLEVLMGLFTSRENGCRSERTARIVADEDATARLREVIRRRVQGERIELNLEVLL
jgi:ATP phosphoribosyltransferase regulatory subunit